MSFFGNMTFNDNKTDWKEDIKDIKARLVILEEINKNLVTITEELKTMITLVEGQNNQINGGEF